MIFWIILAVFIISILFTAFCGRLTSYYSNLYSVGILFSVTSGIFLAIGLIVLVAVYAWLDGYKATEQTQYKSLIFKAQTERIRDDFGIVNKSYIDEVQEWNEDLAAYEANSNNVWIGIFYPKSLCEGLEYIDLDRIAMKLEEPQWSR